jgi:hypothetical protein
MNQLDVEEANRHKIMQAMIVMKIAVQIFQSNG